MNTKRDKKIAEALGLCWHEQDNALPWNSWPQCVCGRWFIDLIDLEAHIKGNTFNFSTFDGIGLILQKGPEREWFNEFAYWLEDKGDTPIRMQYHVLPSKTTWNPLETEYFLSTRLLQDPDRLANELDTFLKEQK